MRRGVAVVVVTVAALLVTAVTAAADTPTDTTTDRERARTGVLGAVDFPAAWMATSRGADSDAVLGAAAAKVARCRAYRSFRSRNTANLRARSRTFREGESRVTNAVSVYASADEAVGVLATFRDATVPRCLERVLGTVLRRTLAHEEKVAERLRSTTANVEVVDGVRLGDDTAAYQGTIGVQLKRGTARTLGFGLVAVRVGPAVSGYTYLADRDISAALQAAIVASGTRLQRAVPSD